MLGPKRKSVSSILQYQQLRAAAGGSGLLPSSPAKRFWHNFFVYTERILFSARWLDEP